MVNLHAGLGVADGDKLGLEGSTTDQETINILLLSKGSRVATVDGATVHDAGGLSNLGVDVLLQPAANGLVDFLGLVGGGNLAGTDGPDGLVGNDNVGPVLDLLGNGSELTEDNLGGLVGLTLLQLLADTGHDLEAGLEGVGNLGANLFIRLLEDLAALRVSENDPLNTEVLEHLSAVDIPDKREMVIKLVRRT